MCPKSTESYLCINNLVYGLGVTFVVACIASTNSKGVTTYESHRFSTYTKGLKDLLQWLLKHNCMDVCMESTGKYWIPVYNVLENDCTIVLAHPKYVKAIRC